MPYSNISELPQSVREAVPSYAGRAMFRAVVNTQLSAGKSESVAFATAWAALQRAGYEKSDGGEWIKKAASYDAPDSARNNARRAIAWRVEHGDDVKGGTVVGWTRASQLASGEKLSLSTVKRMAMFNRHRKNSEVAPEHKGEPWKDAGHVAWLLWGGTSGVDWAKSISGRVTKSVDEMDMDELTAEGNAEIRDMLVAEWNLGPVVVEPPNDEYWSKMAEVWMTDEAQARRQLCANCEYFDNTPDALESMESVPEDKYDADGGGRGYCHKFDFICHNLRACQAWEEMEYEIEKRQYNDDVFTDRLGAIGRSADLGLDGYVHQVMIDGQSMFRPGTTENDYIRAVYGENVASNEKQGLLDDAIRAILQVVMDNDAQYSSSVKIIKMDDEQRVVWGWASVATENGDAVFDVHGDHIPMTELTKASIDFMENVRVGKSLHQGAQTSSVIGCLPLSQELAKALGIETTREGLIMGFRVQDDATWGLIKSGELPALSIGGRGRKYAV
jgi:cation transport regulator ChaB